MKKPPDKYKCIKIPLLHIVQNKESIPIIRDASFRTHKIIVKAYQLVRLWILTKYQESGIVPLINKTVFSTAFKAIKLKVKGKSDLVKEFEELCVLEKEDASQLTQVLEQYSSTEMLTAFENNIKLHFFDYVRRYVNSFWKNFYKDELEKKKIAKKDFYRELSILKKDIFENTKKCNSKYHNWLDENRYKIIPSEFNISYHYDLKVDPQKYLPNMIWMNCELEKITGKMFQFFPLRNNIVRGFIHIDNFTIINLLVEKNKKLSYKADISGIERVLWDTCFKTDVIEKIKIKDYFFDHAFATDGYNASLRFVHIDEYIIKNGLKDIKRQGRKQNKGMSKEDRKLRQDKIKEENKQKKIKKESEKKEKEKKETPKHKPKQKIEEFSYIDEVEIKLLKDIDYVVVDPGKRDLMTIKNTKGECLTYSNSRRIKETKRLKYQRLLHNHRNEQGILEIEKELNGFNCKTTNVELFKQYITKKNEVNSRLYSLYNNKDEKFCKYKWYAFINKKRCEANMVNLIKEKFGKDINIIYGDWSQGKQMRYFMSTPNLNIKRKLAEEYNVFNIDEYRTSKLHYLTEKSCKNIKLKDKDGKTRSKHAILTYKMENNCLGCINRDVNACNNLLKIYQHFLDSNGERLKNYSREVKVPNYKIRDLNLIRKVIPNCKWSNRITLNSSIREECKELKV